MNDLQNFPEDDAEEQPVWQRIWPVLVGILIALALATAGYWVGFRNAARTEGLATASGPSASQTLASGAVASGYASMASASAAEASGVIFQGAFSPAAALQAIFGETAKKGSQSFGRWTQVRLPDGDAFQPFQGRGALLVSSLGVFSVQESGETRKLILFQSVPEDPQFGAHGEGAIIGAAVFRPLDAGWQEVRETRAITVAGAFGQAPAGKPVALSPTQWGILFEGSFSGQGNTERYAFLIDQNDQGFTYDGQSFGLGQDNAGNCDAETPCFSSTGQLRFNPALSGGRFLIDTVLKGTRMGDSGLESFIETRQYRFVAGRYVEDPSKNVVKTKPVMTDQNAVSSAPVATPATAGGE